MDPIANGLLHVVGHVRIEHVQGVVVLECAIEDLLLGDNFRLVVIIVVVPCPAGTKTLVFIIVGGKKQLLLPRLQKIVYFTVRQVGV